MPAMIAVLLLATSFAELDLALVPEDRPEPPPIAERAAAGVEALRRAATPIERALARHRLLDLGPEALAPVREAAASAEGELGPALEEIAVRLLARALEPVIRERLSTGLFFDGQFLDLRERGPDVVPALLVLLDDEEAADGVRRGAVNALADLADPSHLPRLQRLESDILLDPDLRAEVGTLLAILGDTHAVDRTIEKLSQDLDKQVSRPRDEQDLGKVVLLNTELAHTFYRIRKYRRATECYEHILEVFERLEKNPRFRPSPGFLREKALHHYNAACSYSLAGEIEKARQNIRKAVEIDSMHFSNMEQDGDLGKLRRAEGHEAFKKELKTLLEERSI
jgi:tetratricopeptide (TPR) repeat protein